VGINATWITAVAALQAHAVAHLECQKQSKFKFHRTERHFSTYEFVSFFFQVIFLGTVQMEVARAVIIAVVYYAQGSTKNQTFTLSGQCDKGPSKWIGVGT